MSPFHWHVHLEDIELYVCVFSWTTYLDLINFIRNDFVGWDGSSKPVKHKNITIIKIVNILIYRHTFLLDGAILWVKQELGQTGRNSVCERELRIKALRAEGVELQTALM